MCLHNRMRSRSGRTAKESRVLMSDDLEYLKRVEALAGVVCDRALDEGWLTYLPEDHDQTPLQQAINELARTLRHVHTEDDECLS